MGNLKPDVTYIYERQDGVIYAREFGADPSTRQVVGYDWGLESHRPPDQSISQIDQLREDKLWGEIRRLARTNPTLQAELDRVIMLYHLIKEEKPPIAYHPV